MISFHQNMSDVHYNDVHVMLNTGEPVLRDHCHERPPVLKDQLDFSGRRSYIFNAIEPVTKDHLSW